MDTVTPVETGSQGAICHNCGNPLPPKDPRAKEHRFCPGSKCRSAWHGKEKKRALNAALAIVTEMVPAAGETSHRQFVPVPLESLRQVRRELLAAGADGER
jgi:hypothetical protein